MALSDLPFIRTDDPARPALWDEARGWLDYASLGAEIERWRAKASEAAAAKALAFLYTANDVDGVAALLGTLAAGHSVALLDPALPEAARDELGRLYRPEIVVEPAAELAIGRYGTGGTAPHPDLFVLLSTSGSTGTPKFVRLSRRNLEHNATAIAAVLDIAADDVAAGHLPLHYSYGLSVLTSHLNRGAAIALTALGFTDRGFWQAMKAARVSHLPGVPFHYQTLRRLRFERLDLPSLRVMTQAGGHLDLDTRRLAHAYMDGRRGRFHVMYGQTEAAPRITTLAHEDFPSHAASVGTALPGGRLEIRDLDGRPLAAGEEGEVVYLGPNVMLGYAEERSDLALGDTQDGVLSTGDVGRLDEAGRLTITGRLKRFGKVFGLRVNLDEIERLTQGVAESAVVERDGTLVICGTPHHLNDAAKAAIIEAALARFALPRLAYRFELVDELPRNERGKTDYGRLLAMRP